MVAAGRQLFIVALALGAVLTAGAPEPEPPPDPCADPAHHCPTHSKCTPGTGACPCDAGYRGADCSPVSCGPSPAPTHTTGCGGGELVYPQQCTAVCLDGYEGGPLTITCETTGSYSDATSPCKPRTCEAAAPQGSSNTDPCPKGEFEDGNPCTAKCSNGYEYSSGEKTYTCDKDGKWTGGSVECSPVSCGPSPAPAHTTGCGGGVLVYPQQCTAKCIAGYKGDSLEIRCQADGTYSDATSPCDPIVCPAAPPVGARPEGSAQDCKAGHFDDDDGCQAECFAGYDATGERHYKCDTSGAWSVDGSLVCLGKPCTGAPTGGGAGVKEEKPQGGEARHFPSTLQFSCPSSERVAGDSVWICSDQTLKYEPGSSAGTQASSVKCVGCPLDKGNTETEADLTHCLPGKLTCPVELKPDDCCKSFLKCPGWPFHTKKCHQESITSCTECEPGYTVGHPNTCRAQECPALFTDANGKVALTNTAQSKFSGTKAQPMTTMKWTCNQGYILTYSSSGFVAQSLQDTWTCGVNTQGSTVWVDPITNNTDQPLTARCVQTCAATVDDKTPLPNGPCSRSTTIVPIDARNSTCYDNGGTQKFRCTCRAGWSGETCDVDVNECTDTKYIGQCETTAECVAHNQGLPNGCTATGYALEAPNQCKRPYWVDATTHLPSGCDRDHTTDSQITHCTNQPGSWTCGACTETPSCCQPNNTTQPAITLGSTLWHPSKSYTMCDVSQQLVEGVDSHLCPAHPWQHPGCTGVAGQNSLLKLEPATSCEAADSVCSCGSMRAPYPDSSLCIQANDTLTLSIDPRDTHGRLSASNSLTQVATFAIELIMISNPDTDSQVRCVLQNSSHFLQPIQWDNSSYYVGTWTCVVSGLHQLHVRADGADIKGSPWQIQVLPDAAVPEATLVTSTQPGWCISDMDGTADGRPRCRTMNGVWHVITVKIRDRYANERRKQPELEMSDNVTWSVEVAHSKLRRQTGVAVWSEAHVAFALNFTVDDTSDADAFNLNISVNGNASWIPWPTNESRRALHTPEDAVVYLWGYTPIVYAIQLGSLNATACAAYRCDELSTLSKLSENSKSNPDATAAGTNSPSWAQWSQNSEACERAGCFLTSGEEGNPVELQLDWFPHSQVHVKLERYCLGITEKDYGEQYWQRQCNDNIAWNDAENGTVLDTTLDTFDGPFDGFPQPELTNHRCGDGQHGVYDMNSTMCEGSSTEGVLAVSQADIEARCSADSQCAGFVGQPRSPSTITDYFLPVVNYTNLSNYTDQTNTSFQLHQNYTAGWKTWRKHASNGRARAHLALHFRHPGLYQLTIGVTNSPTMALVGTMPSLLPSLHGNWKPDRESLKQTPVLLHVRPGAPSMLTSLMFVHLDHPKPTSGASWHSLSRGQLDPLLGGEGYAFRVESRDSAGNPRGHGTDEVVIEINRMDVLALPDSMKEYQPQDPCNNTVVTSGLNALVGRGSSDSEPLKIMPYSTGDDSSTGVFKFTEALKCRLLGTNQDACHLK
eukprot:COSAG01_NODE_599_length_15010_cov_103.295755_5_plen_1500_part_00